MSHSRAHAAFLLWLLMVVVVGIWHALKVLLHFRANTHVHTHTNTQQHTHSHIDGDRDTLSSSLTLAEQTKDLGNELNLAWQRFSFSFPSSRRVRARWPASSLGIRMDVGARARPSKS